MMENKKHGKINTIDFVIKSTDKIDNKQLRHIKHVISLEKKPIMLFFTPYTEPINII
jgi:hypothetical protein